MSSSLLANQCLTSLKLDLIGMEDSPRNNKNITRNTACLKKGYTCGDSYINRMSMLKTCAQYIIYLSAGMACCFMRHKHLTFQCEYNEDETLASYAKGNYDFYDAEQIEEFVAFKGAYEITSFIENIDDAPYKFESLAILQYCLENYNDNYYITDYLRESFP